MTVQFTALSQACQLAMFGYRTYPLEMQLIVRPWIVRHVDQLSDAFYFVHPVTSEEPREISQVSGAKVMWRRAGRLITMYFMLAT